MKVEPDAKGAAKSTRDKKAERISKKNSSESVDMVEPEAPLASAYDFPQDLQPHLTGTPLTAHDTGLMTWLASMASIAAAPPPMSQLYGLPGGYPGYTTVMLRNIPNRYNRAMLVERLDQGYQGHYDFVYLPIDFNSRCNVGYAFINFRTPAMASKFMSEFHGAKTKLVLPGFSSSKVCEVSYARVQGRHANLENLRDEKFIEKLAEKPDWQPLFLDDYGREISFDKTLGEGGKRKSSKPTTAAAGAAASAKAGAAQGVQPGSATSKEAQALTLAVILPNATASTMVILRNVPPTLSREEVLAFLNERYNGFFDFLFLPGDLKATGHRGFAFINFREPEKATQFIEDLNGKKITEILPQVEAEEDKVFDASAAKMANLLKLIDNLQNPIWDKPAWHPILVNEKGEAQVYPSSDVAKGQTKGAARAADTSKAASGEGQAAPKKKADKTDKKAQKTAEVPRRALPPTLMPGIGYGGYPGYPGYGLPGYGYPGYPYMPPLSPLQAQYAAAQAAQYFQYQQLQAARALQAAQLSAAQSSLGGILDPLAAAVKPQTRQQPLLEEKKVALRKQIEHYFSMENMCKDLYLRAYMDPDGWTPLDLVAGFPQVRKFNPTSEDIVKVLNKSDVVEVNEKTRCIRLKSEKDRAKWANAQVPLEVREQIAPTAAFQVAK